MYRCSYRCIQCRHLELHRPESVVIIATTIARCDFTPSPRRPSLAFDDHEAAAEVEMASSGGPLSSAKGAASHAMSPPPPHFHSPGYQPHSTFARAKPFFSSPDDHYRFRDHPGASNGNHHPPQDASAPAEEFVVSKYSVSTTPQGPQINPIPSLVRPTCLAR